MKAEGRMSSGAGIFVGVGGGVKWDGAGAGRASWGRSADGREVSWGLA